MRDPRHHPAWSSLLALIGMLAVLLGVQASRLELGRSLTPSAHTAPLPELRAFTPLPETDTGTPPALPPAPLRLVGQRAAGRSQRVWTSADLPRLSLAVLGRRQAEGG